jgi:hypothetical protein
MFVVCVEPLDGPFTAKGQQFIPFFSYGQYGRGGNNKPVEFLFRVFFSPVSV